MRLAFTTFAILRAPYGNAMVQEFDDRTPDVFDQAEHSPGFVARATETGDSELSNFERDWGPWGRFAVPRFYTLGRTTADDQRASTLSLWEDLPSVYGFVYGDLHLAALRKRHEWFLTPEWPTYACWWVPDDVTPRWSDAAARLELLHDDGPRPAAFDFTQPYEADGRATSRRRIRAEVEARRPRITAIEGTGR